MTAKEFLRRARNVDRRVDVEETIERVERMRTRLETGRMSNITGMPRGGARDWTETADRLIDLEQRITARTRERMRWMRAAMDAIAAVDDSRLRQLLELYYLDGFTWGQVAERMGTKEKPLDLRWVFRLHGKALMRVKVPEEVETDAKENP